MEKYIHYDINDFAQEDSFINWAKQSNKEDVAFWEHWLKANPEKRDVVEKARALVLGLSFEEKAVNPVVKSRVWERIEAQTNTIAPEAQTVPMIRRIIPAIAAACVAFALFFFMQNKGNEVRIGTNYASTNTVQLPDESTVSLNADSKVEYNSKTWDSERTLHLKGEAFFEVQKGERFTVHTDYGNVEVLGTSFNVFARNGVLKVTCETGKVAVSSGTERTILTPNNSVTAIENTHKTSTDISRGTWRRGLYSYDATPLSEIVSDLERQYDIRIKMDETLKSKEFTGKFNVNNREKALSEVFWTLNLKYSTQGDVITINE